MSSTLCLLVKMKTYTVSKEYKYFIIPLIFLVLTWGSMPPYESSREIYLGPIAAFAALYLLYRILITPYKIVVRDNRLFEFHSIIRKAKIYSDEILSIKDYMGTILIKHSTGKIYVSSLMDNISGFKAVLLSLRPDLKVEDLANKRFDPKNTK